MTSREVSIQPCPVSSEASGGGGEVDTYRGKEEKPEEEEEEEEEGDEEKGSRNEAFCPQKNHLVLSFTHLETSTKSSNLESSKRIRLHNMEDEDEGTLGSSNRSSWGAPPPLLVLCAEIFNSTKHC